MKDKVNKLETMVCCEDNVKEKFETLHKMTLGDETSMAQQDEEGNARTNDDNIKRSFEMIATFIANAWQN